MIMPLVNTRESTNQPTKAEPEGEGYGEVVTLRRAAESDSEQAADNLRTLLQRVAATSMQEIDKIINEMLTLREALESRSARIQSDITAYAHFSQSAMQSTKIISESLAGCRVAGDHDKLVSDNEAALLAAADQELCRATTGLRLDGSAASPAPREGLRSTESPARIRHSSTR
jgi:hypothetical protein